MKKKIGKVYRCCKGLRVIYKKVGGEIDLTDKKSRDKIGNVNAI